jgi:hypothetical protein
MNSAFTRSITVCQKKRKVVGNTQVLKSVSHLPVLYAPTDLASSATALG